MEVKGGWDRDRREERGRNGVGLAVMVSEREEDMIGVGE